MLDTSSSNDDLSLISINDECTKSRAEKLKNIMFASIIDYLKILKYCNFLVEQYVIAGINEENASNSVDNLIAIYYAVSMIDDEIGILENMNNNFPIRHFISIINQIEDSPVASDKLERLINEVMEQALMISYPDQSKKIDDLSDIIFHPTIEGKISDDLYKYFDLNYSNDYLSNGFF